MSRTHATILSLSTKIFFNAELSNGSDTKLSPSCDQPHSYYLFLVLWYQHLHLRPRPHRGTSTCSYSDRILPLRWPTSTSTSTALDLVDHLRSPLTHRLVFYIDVDHFTHNSPKGWFFRLEASTSGEHLLFLKEPNSFTSNSPTPSTIILWIHD